MLVKGFKVAESDKAVGFVRAQDVRDGVGIMWVPLAKVSAMIERDEMSRRIETNKGDRMGVPVDLDIDDAFLAKIGVA